MLSDKVFMRAALYDSAVFEHHNHVGILYGRKPVCDNENRSALHKSVRTLLNEKFGSGIDRRGCFVHYHNGRIGNGGMARALPG